MSTALDDYLQFRQRLSTFGSFFGPNPAYIPERVVQEISSWSLPTKTFTRPQKPNQPEEIPAKKKADLTKNSRDYSNLLSHDPVVPTAPEKTSNSAKPDTPEEIPAKKKPEVIKNSRNYSTLLSDDPSLEKAEASQPRKQNPLPMQPKKKAAPEPEVIKNSKASDYSFLSSDQTKNIIAPKSSLSKNIASLAHLMTKENSNAVLKKQIADVKRKRLVRAREEDEEDDEPRLRKGAAVARRRDDDDEEDDQVDTARIMIRKMFGYNPEKYRDDDRDDRSMVAGFHDIEKEENRSARIGRKTDAEEQRKNEEEEMRARLKKKKKNQASKRSLFL